MATAPANRMMVQAERSWSIRSFSSGSRLESQASIGGLNRLATGGRERTTPVGFDAMLDDSGRKLHSLRY